MNKLFSFAALAMLSIASTSRAQSPTFTSPIADEFVYGIKDLINPDHISCNSARNIDYDGVGCDLYVSSWGDSEHKISEFIYQFAKSNTTLMAFQGSRMYNDVAGLSTAIIYDNNYGTRIFVAYYKYGSGHFVDVYDVTSSPTNPVVLTSTVQLSTSHDYGRISIDGLFYAGQLSIVWANPGEGIQTIVYSPGGWWSNVSTIYNTGEQVAPDVAMRYDGNSPDINIVYNDIAGNISETTFDWSTLNSLPAITPTIVYPSSVDVINPFGAGQYITPPVIDCPDLGAPNWAYTFSNGTDVFVRSVDYTVATPVFSTTEMTTGAAPLNNVPLNASRTYSPTLHYGYYNTNSGIINDGITVAWYGSDGNYNGYMGVQMNPDAQSLINAQDYMGLPNAFTPYPMMERPGIAISKSDLEAVPDYEYTVYYSFDESVGVYVLHHAFHPWNNNVFKGNKDLKVADNTYPNPFSNEIHTTITASENGFVSLQLVDITGRMVSQKKFSAQKGQNAFIIEGLQNVIPGTYFLNTTVNGKNVNTQVVVKH
ncbi:hypothetical protein D3C86_1150970 [compost metagenome]